MLKQAYLEALNKLIDLVERSRDVLLSNHEKYEESLGAIIFLGDKRYGPIVPWWRRMNIELQKSLSH